MMTTYAQQARERRLVALRAVKAKRAVSEPISISVTQPGASFMPVFTSARIGSARVTYMT